MELSSINIVGFVVYVPPSGNDGSIRMEPVSINKVGFVVYVPSCGDDGSIRMEQASINKVGLWFTFPPVERSINKDGAS